MTTWSRTTIRSNISAARRERRATCAAKSRRAAILSRGRVRGLILRPRKPSHSATRCSARRRVSLATSPFRSRPETCRKPTPIRSVFDSGRALIAVFAKPLAKTAISARPESNTERIGVGFRQVSGRLRKGLVAKLTRRLAEQRVAEWLGLRGRRIRPRTRPLERIAALLDFVAQVARRSRRAAEIFERIVVRLQVVIGDAPILNGHILWKKRCAVSLGQMSLQHEIGRQEAPGFRVPMD